MVQTTIPIKTHGFLLDGRWLTEGEPFEVLAPYGRSVVGTTFRATASLPRVERLKLGDPLDEATDVGPMISEDAARRAAEAVDEAVRAGARALCGGARQGAMLAPTVLTGTRPDLRVNCLEIFAPVVTVEPYSDFDAALEQVNNSSYGLQAGVFTRDTRRIFAAYEELEVGGVIVNDVPTFRMDHMPYGGMKDSGTGREGLRYAIEEMTERKLLAVNLT